MNTSANSQTIEHSPFGYWIAPDGNITPMSVMQDHGAWIMRNSVFDRPFDDATEAVEHAVSMGWVGISISPIGTSCGIRVREGAITTRAARALKMLIKFIGFDNDEVYTDFHSGRGKDIVGAILNASWDDEDFTSPFDGADAKLESLNRLRFKGAQRIWAAEALKEGSLPDIARAKIELDAYVSARRRVHESAYGWSKEGFALERNNDIAGLLKVYDEVRGLIVANSVAMTASVERAWAALHGAPDPYLRSPPPGFEPVTHPVHEQPLQAIVRYSNEYKALMDDLQSKVDVLEFAAEPLREPLRTATLSILSLGLEPLTLRGNIRRLDQAVGETNKDAVSLHRSMAYYLCHECGGLTGRSLPKYNTILAYFDTLGKVVADLTEGKASQPVRQ